MMGFEYLLDDRETAAVMTYVRNSFANQAPAITPAQVEKVRAEVKDKKGHYMVEELLKMHPMKSVLLFKESFVQAPLLNRAYTHLLRL